MNGGGKDGSDMNVLEAWSLGYTGRGVVVTILDDGIQRDHPDLKDNYDPLASKDINDNDEDPMPQDNGDNKHGTRCAGEVAAAADNEYCGAGIAHRAGIGGVRMLDGLVNDAVEARALSLNPSHIDIYSASWGPEDDGRTVDGPGPLAKQAFTRGVAEGRGGKGSIFVWASGNGGHHTDNCNCDGYTNSIYTLSISSATQAGTRPWYLEQCSSTLASTYSSGTPGQHASITTVDQDKRLRPGHICTDSHTGTSASAPLAAGVVALALEAAPQLTWRDLQHLVVLTSNPRPLLGEPGWQTNSLGRAVSHKFGYGLLDAGLLVRRAANWSLVPEQRICETRLEAAGAGLGAGAGQQTSLTLITDGCDNTASSVTTLEHVQARISLKFAPRGDLKISLTSPRGTTSHLLLPRPKDRTASSFDNWPFLSVHYWGEDPTGEWRLTITNTASRNGSRPGQLRHWQLVLHGTAPDTTDTREAAPGTAAPCHAECRDTCSGPGPQHCAACRHVSHNQTCVAACPPGSWAHPLEPRPTCRPCHATCLTCYAEAGDQCASCPPGRFLLPDQSTCVTACPPGHVASPSTGRCAACPRHCLACTDPDTCTACDEATLLSRGACLARCGPGAFLDPATRQCAACHPTCGSCVGPADTECDVCKKDLIYFERRCVSYCPAGYTLSRARAECVACPLGCDTCPETAASCTNCTAGWAAAGEECRAPGSAACQPGLYRGRGACLACHASCRTCSGGGAEACTSCYPDYKQHRTTCLLTCPAGTFPAPHGNQCVSCPHACATCNATQCLSCRPRYHLKVGSSSVAV